MTTRVCPTCRAQADRTTLLRCSVPSCPMQKERTAAAAASVRVALLTVVGAVLVIAVVGSFGWTITRSPTERAASGGFAGAVAPRVRQWANDLTGSTPQPEPVVVARPAAEAATRVASFDCGGALTRTRTLICTDWTLATADYNLDLAYRSALAKSGNPDAMRRAQRAWLVELDRVGSDPEQVVAAYHARMEALEGR